MADADIAVPAALMADPGRARMLLALTDGRALPAGVLRAEAGVATSTASEHLKKLCAAGLLRVEQHGRHRYYRLASVQVARAIEALARISPQAPVRSLREGTRAEALRRARMCYDHLAGRLGVALMSAMLQRGALVGGDGRYDPQTALRDRPSAPGHDVDYRLTPVGTGLVRDLGIDLDRLAAGKRQLIRYCVDWTEQRHHLAGSLGSAVADQMLSLGWLKRRANDRAVLLTPAGAAGLSEVLGVELPEPIRRPRVASA
jgi:DNA-binding transcriptional ArsR family regulator